MTLTRSFKETVISRIEKDPKFKNALLIAAINELFEGDVEAGKILLRDYINATISFDGLAKKLDKNSKSIQRMLGPNGNPTTKSLFSILHIIQKHEGLHFKISIERSKKTRNNVTEHRVG